MGYKGDASRFRSAHGGRGVCVRACTEAQVHDRALKHRYTIARECAWKHRSTGTRSCTEAQEAQEHSYARGSGGGGGLVRVIAY
ncbi:hypothetical protein XENTR_v10001121 [Xenopus tropicalis]|nr:hypothetical protein XENTR_v10001121 [Xenopus tropicalis]